MARKPAQRRKYGGAPVVGNLAYDYDYDYAQRRAAQRRAPRREEPEEIRTETPAVRREPRKAARPRTRVRQKVSFGMVLGFSALAVLVVAVLLSYAELTAISSDVVSLQSDLATLEDEHVELLAEYEQTFNLAAVKEAAQAAGMYKPSSSQIYYIDLSAPDSVVLYEQEDVSVLSKMFTSLGRGVCAVVEYFQ